MVCVEEITITSHHAHFRLAHARTGRLQKVTCLQVHPDARKVYLFL
jgi:hypothetical protein